MKKIFVIFLFCCSGVFAADQTYVLTIEEWSVPRRAETLLSMPALAEAMKSLQKTPDSRLLIRYPGGDEGTLWAYELRGWLISLGLSSQRIELSPGSPNAEIIQLDVNSSSLRPIPTRQHNNQDVPATKSRVSDRAPDLVLGGGQKKQ